MATRRSFLRNSITGLVCINTLSTYTYAQNSSETYLQECKDNKLRFALASDGHYGQDGIDSEKNYSDLVTWMNKENEENPLSFIIINGDIVHDKPELLEKVNEQYFKKLTMPYYTVVGNHDHAEADLWQKVFGYPDNYSFINKDVGFIVANTSNIKGEFLCPSYDFLHQELETFKNLDLVFVVLHIPPIKWLTEEFYNAECEDILNLLHQYANVKAVFHGHDHSLDGLRYHKKMPHIFDGHFGGNWGTVYKGYRIVEISEKNEVITYQVNASNSPIINKNVF